MSSVGLSGLISRVSDDAPSSQKFKLMAARKVDVPKHEAMWQRHSDPVKQNNTQYGLQGSRCHVSSHVISLHHIVRATCSAIKAATLLNPTQTRGGGGKKSLLRTPRQNFLKGTPRTTHPPPTPPEPLFFGP